MEINPHRSVPPIPKSERKKKADRTLNKSQETDSVDFAGSELFSVIESGLEAMPEVREDRLELGRKLAEDPNYPNEDELDELSDLTLKNLPSEEDQELE